VYTIEFENLRRISGLRYYSIVSQFDIVPLLVNLGSGIALLGIATLITDLLVLYILPKHKYYQLVKYEEIKSEMDENRPLLTKPD